MDMPPNPNVARAVFLPDPSGPHDPQRTKLMTFIILLLYQVSAEKTIIETAFFYFQSL